jgi:hypothetical protein
VERVHHRDGFEELHFTPPLVYNYEATQEPGIPEWQRNVLQLATPGLGRKLQLRIKERHAPSQDATLQLGPYLLVYEVLVDFDSEVEHVEEALDLDEGGEVPPDMMTIEGVLTDDPEAHFEIWIEIAATALLASCDTIKRMARAFKVRAAVRRIEAAFKRWKWKKEVAWNPHTALGRLLLQLGAEAHTAESLSCHPATE